MKKFTTMAICFVLIACMVAGGSLAYLTDKDGAANVFTVGDVNIQLNEEFPDNKLAPGKTLQKEATITNTGANDAYVWMTVAIPAALDNVDASQNVIHWNIPGAFWNGYHTNQQYIDSAIANGYQPVGGTYPVADAETWILVPTTETVLKDGINYNVYTLLYNSALAPTKTTNIGLSEVYLDKAIDIDEDGNWSKVVAGVEAKLDWNVKTNGNPIIYVGAYGMQTDGFTDVNAAYEAYTAQWTTDAGVNNGLAWGGKVKVEGADKAAVVNAIENANPGDTVVLAEDTIIAGYAATEKLIIDKAITLDLNGKTLTTESGWGGIDLKGGASIVNGTINHTGNTAAIKAFQVGTIKDVTINVTETAGKTKGGIVVQEGAGCYVGSIENVTIIGATNGIETYRCGDRADFAIGSMTNVTIDAIDTGMLLSAPVGTATNCDINGDNIGINMYLYGPYSVSINLVDSEVSGNTGIYAHDEAGKTNPGSFTLKYDSATTITGGITEEFENEVKDRVSIN